MIVHSIVPRWVTAKVLEKENGDRSTFRSSMCEVQQLQCKPLTSDSVSDSDSDSNSDSVLTHEFGKLSRIDVKMAETP